MPNSLSKILFHPTPPDFPSGGLGNEIKLPANTKYLSPFESSPFKSTFNSDSAFQHSNNNSLPILEQKSKKKSNEIFKKESSGYLLSTATFSGSKILEEYQKHEPQTNELLVWYEDSVTNKGQLASNLFGDFCLTKMKPNGRFKNLLEAFEGKGTNVNGKISNKQFQLTKQSEFLAYVSVSFKNNYGLTIDKQILQQALNIERNLNISQQQVQIGYVTLEGHIIDAARKALESIKLTEENYQPNGANGKEYSPILPIETIKKIIKNAVEDDPNNSSAFNLASQLQKVASAFDSIKYLLDDSKNPLKKFATLFKDIATTISNLEKSLKEIGEKIINGLEIINAFLCGLINGLISLVDLVLYLLSCVYGSMNDVKTVSASENYFGARNKMEGVEDFLDLVSEKWEDIKTAILNCLDNYSEDTLKSLAVALGIADWNRYDWAYVAGSFVFEVLVGVAMAVVTGGTTAVAQATTKTAKILASLRVLAVEALSAASMGISDMINLLRNIITAFCKAAVKGMKGVNNFLGELRKGKLVAQESEEIENVLNKADEFANATKAIDDITEALIERYKKLIEDVLSNPPKLRLANNIMKGNFGEIMTELKFLEKEWTFGENTGRFKKLHLGEITDLNQAPLSGIDHVFEFSTPPPKYVIVESKYGSSKLSKLVSGIMQMSDQWILGDSRLVRAVGFKKRNEILLDFENGCDRVLSQIGRDNSIKFTKLDSKANKTGKWY